MDDDNEFGQLTVMQGVMAPSSNAVAGLPALPPTRPLAADELAKIDEEEGLDGSYASALGQGGGSSYTFAEMLGMAGGLIATIVVVLLFFPFARFFGTRLANDGNSYSAAIPVPAGKGAETAKGASAKQTLKEVESMLQARRFTEVVDRCRRDLDSLPDDREVHRAWERVWAVYFETLGMMDRRAEMLRGFRKLASVNPDSDSLVYYRVRGWLDEISHANAMSELSEATRQNYLDILKGAERDCGRRTTARNSTSTPQNESDIHFLLLLGETQLLEWMLRNRPTDTDGLALFSSAIDTLRRLPEDDARRGRLELRAWEEFRRGLRAWHSLPAFSPKIAGEAIDAKWVDERIVKLRTRLSGGRK